MVAQMGRALRGKSFRTSQSRPYELTDGVIRQINEGHVLTFQTLFELQYDAVAFVRGAEISDPDHHRLFTLLVPTRSERNGRARPSNGHHGAHGRTRTLGNGAAECTVHPAPPHAD